MSNKIKVSLFSRYIFITHNLLYQCRESQYKQFDIFWNNLDHVTQEKSNKNFQDGDNFFQMIDFPEMEKFGKTLGIIGGWNAFHKVSSFVHKFVLGLLKF